MPDLFLRQPSAPDSAPPPHRAPRAESSARSAADLEPSHSADPYQPLKISANIPLEPSSNPLLPVRDAATILGVSPGTLASWRRRNTGPPYVIASPNTNGKPRYRYRLSDLHAWLAERKRQPGRPLPPWMRMASRVDTPPRSLGKPVGLDRVEGAGEVLRSLWRAVQTAGSVLLWCRRNGLADYHAVSDILDGRKAITPRVAAALGYRVVRIARYVKLNGPDR